MKNTRNFLVAGAVLCACAAQAVTVALASDPVEPGKWHPDYDKVMAKANAENIPVIAILGGKTCSYCNRLDAQLETLLFTAWQAERQYLMLYVKAQQTKDWNDKNSSVYKTLNELTGTGDALLPRIGFYWLKKGASTPAVKTGVNGRGWVVPAAYTTGADKETKMAPLTQTFMNHIDSLFGSYSPVPPVGQVNLLGTPSASLIEGGDVTLQIARTDGNDGAVSATLAWDGDTSGLVFPDGQSVTWDAGEEATKSIVINFPVSAGYQAQQVLTATLGVTPEDAVGTATTFTLTLTDALAPTVAVPTAPADLERISFYGIEDSVALAWPAVGWPVGTQDPALFVCWESEKGTDGRIEVPADATGTNAVAIGMVSTNDAVGAVIWWLEAQFTPDSTPEVVSSPRSAFTVYEAPSFDNLAEGDSITVYKTVAANIQVTVTSGTPVTFNDISKSLPKGLKFVAQATGFTVSGTPTVATGSFPITITATDADGEATSLKFTIVAAALPATKTGKFNVVFENLATGELFGFSTMTVSTSGRITCRITGQKKNYAFSSGVWTDAGDSVFETTMNIARTGESLYMMVDALGNVTGELIVDDALYAVRGHRVVTLPAGFAGYYTIGLPVIEMAPVSETVDFRPQGSSYLTLTINANGSVRYSGKAADGTGVSGSAIFIAGETGIEIPVFKPLYSKAGLFAGIINLEKGETPTLNRATGTAVWKNAGKATYANADGFSGQLGIVGGWFAKGQALSEYYADRFLFGVAGPDIATVNQDVIPKDLEIGMARNNLALKAADTTVAKTTFKALPTTGVITGSFVLQNQVETLRGITIKSIKTPVYGILLRNCDNFGGVGYYIYKDSVVAPNNRKISSLKRSYGVSLTPVE